ncbi:MAG: signal peptidase II [Ruminococcus sp.]|nr:signal peptidase II [Ruminococcus sp.]
MSRTKRYETVRLFGLIPLIVSLDMAVKLIVTRFFMGTKLLLFGGIIGFKPHINREQMGINMELSRLGMSISNEANIVVNILILITVGALLWRLNYKRIYGKPFAVGSAIGIASCICSLYDKIIWGGSPDYIYLLNKYIIDLKDIGLVTGSLICVITFFKTERDRKKTGK